MSERTMWNRFRGKADNLKDDPPSQNSWRNVDERRHPALRLDSTVSPTFNKKATPVADDWDPRGFDRASTGFSPITQGQLPEAASSYTTESGKKNGESSMTPSIVSNVNLEDQMPNSGSSRSLRDQKQSHELRDKKRGKTETSDGLDQDIKRRQRRDERDSKDKSLRGSKKGFDEEFGTSRDPENFPDQVANSGFSHFPGQYDGAIPGSIGSTQEHLAMSSHVQDQFPGQFPTQSSAPYRPPLAASEGGPGLAAEYYGDAGQSVAEQPGNRVDTPSVIIGAEPHLQPASAVAAPPPEPSASGAVGAAASFFSGDFEEDEATSTHAHQTSSTYITDQIRPNSNYHSSSAPVVPTMSGTAIGSIAGYFMDNQISSHQQRPDHESSVAGAPSEYSSNATHLPPSEMQDLYYSSNPQPTKPGMSSSQPSSIPMYAAGVVGATGLAAAAHEQNHQSSNQVFSSVSQHSTNSMAQRHRSHGPLTALLNFFKDPEGVAQFEEYSQIIGVCRHCFAPGSSPRDAPRRHFYWRRRSNERYGSSTRVDKDSRYYSSENEGRRKNKSWLITGLAGYGLAKFGETILNEKDDFDDAYDVRIRRSSPSGRDRRAQRGNRSGERVEIDITDGGKLDRKESRDDNFKSMKITPYTTRRHSKPRSRSQDDKASLAEATVGTAQGSFMFTSSSRRHSRSPRGTSVKSKRISQASSPERHRKTKKKNGGSGFFSFSNRLSSSSSIDSAYTGSRNTYRNCRSSTGKPKDDKDAEAAILGLGAAAAALALNDQRQSRRKGIRELVGVKKSKPRKGHGSAQAHISKKTPEIQDEALWESAAEDDYDSTNSDLAYGAPPVGRDSRASLSSESSGTNKWGWRWGSKRNRRASSPQKDLPDRGSFPAGASGGGSDLTGATSAPLDQRRGSVVTSTSSLPLQHVYPVPTSDPSRFDVGPEEPSSVPNRPNESSRPKAVPLQHPRPIAPVSAAIYSSQNANDHSYTAPAGVAAFCQNSCRCYPGTPDARHSTCEASQPGSLPRVEQQADDINRNVRIRRRQTSPARYNADSMSSSMASRRHIPTKDGSSAVRFDLTEEQEERARRERRRQSKSDKERREAEEQQKTGNDDGAYGITVGKRDSKANLAKDPESFEKSWIGPAAAGCIGAAIGTAPATETSRSEKAREQRRERRRRERELEDEEDALNNSERRRRQRARDSQEVAIQKRGRLPDEISASSEYADYQGRSQRKQNMSVWQEAASTKRSSSHENYGAFFTPLELLNKTSDQVKSTSANADADIDLEQVPQIVTVEPKRIHDLSDSPTVLFADTEVKVAPSKPSFPWQVPRLRLVEPTPPSTRGSTPTPRPENADDNGFEEPRMDRSPSKVKWADDPTHNYTIIAPKEDHDTSIEPLSQETSGEDPVTSSKSTYDRDLPDDKISSRNSPRTESSSASYGVDVDFAATLAASAEDAGFDPSIVLDNPIYRRRDSPPGSSEPSMDSGPDVENESRSRRKKRKRREKVTSNPSQNGDPNRRNDGAIVQDVIRQIEDPHTQPLNQFPSEAFEDEWQTRKRPEYTKSEEKQNVSESGDKSFETSDTARDVLGVENRHLFESPIEDFEPVALIDKEAEGGRRPCKESHGGSTGFDEAESTVSYPSTTVASKEIKPKPAVNRKSSIWDRVLGKPAQSLPQEIGAKDVTERAAVEGLEEPEITRERHQERDSNRDRDDHHNSGQSTNIGFATSQSLDRNPHKPPVNVLVPGARALPEDC